jgi:hypothetical protein
VSEETNLGSESRKEYAKKGVYYAAPWTRAVAKGKGPEKEVLTNLVNYVYYRVTR